MKENQNTCCMYDKQLQERQIRSTETANPSVEGHMALSKGSHLAVVALYRLYSSPNAPSCTHKNSFQSR